MSRANKVQVLKLFRKCRIRRPDIVLSIGKSVLDESNSIWNSFWSLFTDDNGNEKWLICEQVYLAALDCNNKAVAEECLKLIKKAFQNPNSQRIQKLEGMHREFEGKFKEAEEIYNKIKVENPTNLSVMKRLVCIHKAQSNYNKAITELNDILMIYVTDIATWEELGELYLWESNYQAALFCYEELLVLDSTNSNYHVRVADIYYTLGEYDGLMKARKHYTFALNLLAPALNPRGLYGLLTTAKILAQEYYNGNEEGMKRSSLYSKEDEAVNKALVDFANDEVAKHFAKKALGKVITKALASA